MIGFVTSVSGIGPVLIGLFGLMLWQLASILRGLSRGNGGADRQQVQPGEDPSHLEIGAYLSAHPSNTHAPSETHPR